MFADKLEYRTIGTGGGALTLNPTGFFGIVALTDITDVGVSDGPISPTTMLYEGAMTKGQVVHFGGNGFAVKNGLFVAVVGAADAKVNVFFG